MSDPLHQLQIQLKDANQSLTSPRQVIFQALQEKEPQSMKQLVAACQDQVDRATVYRTVSLFERLGIVQRLQLGWKYKLELTDSFTHHHHHLTCLRCSSIIPLAEDQALEERLRLLAAHHAFKPQDHQIEISGLCQNCRAA
jgi:Fur family ferric uptake transcriptional regulator